MSAIKGKVIDSYSNEGIKGAMVWVTVEGITDQHFSTETSEMGSFVLTNIATGIYSLYTQFSISQYSFGKSIKNIELSEDTVKEVIVSLEISGALIGKVRDAYNGLPIQGASIRIIEDKGEQIASATDRDGNYSIGFVRPGSYMVKGTIEGYQEITLSVYVDSMIREKGETKFDLFMKPLDVSERSPNGIVRGIVLDQSDNSLFGAQIELIGIGFLKKTTVASRGINYYLGNFCFDEVLPGSYRLVVSKPDYKSIEREIVVEKGKVTWVNDLVPELTVKPPPPELEYIKIEPKCIALGNDVKVIVKSRDPEIKGASVTVRGGQRGWSMGCALDDKETDGGRSRILRNWQVIGKFKIPSVSLTNKYGQSFNIPVDTIFEVFQEERGMTAIKEPKLQKRTGGGPIFTKRYSPGTTLMLTPLELGDTVTLKHDDGMNINIKVIEKLAENKFVGEIFGFKGAVIDKHKDLCTGDKIIFYEENIIAYTSSEK